jgi:hypothetical protein
MAPMWDGFDEPFHLAYVEFVAAHGRPPGFHEPSLPAHYLTLNRNLPSMVGYGAPSFVEWKAMGEDERLVHRRAAGAWKPAGADGTASYAGENYERQQGPLFYFLAAPVSLLFREVSLPLLRTDLFCNHPDRGAPDCTIRDPVCRLRRAPHTRADAEYSLVRLQDLE